MLASMATTGAAYPFDDDRWRRIAEQMQASLQSPAWQVAIKQQKTDIARRLNAATRGVDWSKLAETLRVAQGAQFQEAIQRLTADSTAAVRWGEIAKQINIAATERVSPSEAAIDDLRDQLADAGAPGIADADSEASAPGFAWITGLPTKGQVNLLLVILTVLAGFSTGAASATGVELPGRLAPFIGALLILAGYLNEEISRSDDDAADADDA